MKEFRTYVFDLDGTLLDTLDDLTASVNHALTVYGMPTRNREEVRQFVGNGVRQLIRRSVGPDCKEEIMEQALETFRAHYSKHNIDKTKPYDGIIQMLRLLKERGKKVAVVSNKFDTATKNLCRHFFGQMVDVAIGESENVRRKPAPDSVIEALRCLDEGPEGAVYIGDSDVDIETAKAAGLPCISVSWGFRDKPFLISHGAQTIISSPSCLVINLDK